MARIRILNAAQVGQLLTMRDVIEGVEEIYRLYSTGRAGVWPTIFHEFQPGVRDMDIKSGFLDGAGVFGLKMVAWSAENPSRGLPALSGVVVVADVDTGFPLGIVDGMSLTSLRTGAAGAVGAARLARPDAARVLVCGTGAQGRAQLAGLAEVLPSLRQVDAASPDREGAAAYAEEMGRRYPDLTIRAVPWEDRGEAAAQAQVVVACTPSREAYLKSEWIRPGTHINAIGTDARTKQELEPELVRRCRLVADSRAQTLDHGELYHAYSAGLVRREDVAEMGEVLEGLAPGRNSPEEITLFDSTGMALQDLICAHKALRKAEEADVGILVEL